MKKFLALILAVLMIAGSAVSVAAFDDVSGKYADAINGLQATGIVAGTSETTFTPDALVTRWQMALFMARAASAVTDDADWAEGAKIFTDCTQYLGAIQYCFGRGIIKGVTATEFAPDNNILFRDGIIMAIRALGYEKEDEGLEASAKKYNKTGAAYWTPYYERAIELGLLENLGNVAVDKALTRAETAQLIYNMLYTPVYAKDGANTNNYTLYDVAFGGKAIVEVENSMKAWVAETPGYFFGTNDTLDADDEEIVIAWNEYDEDAEAYTVETDNVTFDELTKWGVDVENIDEYFAAALEIINYDKDDVSDFEYLANFEKVAPKALTNADVKFTYNADDSIKYAKIGTKTHYEAGDGEKNEIALYTVDTADDDLDEIVYAATTFEAIDGNNYDLVVYDVDGDNYFEYGYVNFYKMDVYEEANTKGVEQFGDMDGLTEVVYSETLKEGDVFVYAFDLATKTVSVKEVVEAATGKITGYSEKKTDDGIVGYVTIGGTKYTIDPAANNPITIVDDGETGIDETTADDLKTAAAAGIAKTYEYYTLGGKLVAFGKEITEEAAVNYLIIKDFTDFELYDHVVMTAFIDGEDKEIKVQKITRINKETGEALPASKLNTKGYSALAAELQGLFGIYTYTVDADDYYTLTEKPLAHDVADFIGSDTAIKFKDGVQTNAKVSAEEEEDGLIARNKMLRLSADTAIYLIDTEQEKITTVAAKTSGEFEIPVAATAKFYADKIGFGQENISDEWTTGVASVIYIEANGAKDAINAANYKLIFVQEEAADLELGTAAGFGIKDTDGDETKDQAYVKYDVSDKAFVLSTFAGVDTVYVEKGENVAPLADGAYVIDAEGKVVASKSLDDIKAAANGDIYLTVTDASLTGTAKFYFTVAEIASTEIDLYNYADIRIDDADNVVQFDTRDAARADANSLKANIQTLHFMDLTINEDDEIVTKFYDATVAPTVKPALIKLMEDYEADDETVKVIYASNKANAAFDYKTAVANKTLNAVIINNIGE